MKKKIIAITGARSEYDLMFSIYDKLRKNENFDFSLIVTGPHLSETYGLTSQYIEKDGFKIVDWVFNLIDSGEKLARVSSIGNQIPLIAQTLYREKPDIVIVAGDREDVMSVALICAYMNIPLAHFFGGDIAKDGNIDNSIRYATSKLAHIHFVTLEQHKQTLLRLGEDEWRIFVVGNPALDRFLNTSVISKKELLTKLVVDFNLFNDYAVLIQHSIITEVEIQSKQIRITLDALVESGIKCFINFPNSDAGSHAIIQAYNEYIIRYPEQFSLFKNLDREMFVNLLRNARFLIGNSSSGLLEAPSLGLPVINVGLRQKGRVHGKNVLFVDNNNEQILAAIFKVLNDDSFLSDVAKKENPYGKGNTSEKVMSILMETEINDNLIYKNITY